MKNTMTQKFSQIHIALKALILFFIVLILGFFCFASIAVISTIALKSKIEEQKETILDKIVETEKNRQNLLNNPKETNETIKFTEAEWKVKEVKVLSNPLTEIESYKDCTKIEGMTFIRVKVNVKNNLNVERKFYLTKLFSEKNKSYFQEAVEDLCYGYSGAYNFEKIPPYSEKEYDLLFILPKGESNFKLEVTNLNDFDSEKNYIKINF